MFFQPPPTAAVAPSSRVLLSRTSRALLSRLRADFCSSCWIFSVVLVSYRNKTEVSSCDPSRRRRSRATLEVPFSRGDGDFGGVTGGDVPVPGTSPGTGARRRDVSGAAPLARPCPRRLGGLESPEWVSGGGSAESLRGLSRTRGSCRRIMGRRVGNGGRRRTLGVDAAAHDLRRAHDTTRSTPSEEEGVQGPPRARGLLRRELGTNNPINQSRSRNNQGWFRQELPKSAISPGLIERLAPIFPRRPAWHSIFNFS